MTVSVASLLQFLRDELRVDVKDVDLTTPLFSGGVIDSFAMVELITHLEQRCNVHFEPTDISLENLDSIECILALVERLRPH